MLSEVDTNDANTAGLLAHGIEDLRAQFGANLFTPQINWQALSFAAFDSHGQQLSACGEFPNVPPQEIMIAWARSEKQFVPMRVVLDNGLPSCLALVDPSAVQSWGLDATPSALATAKEAVIVGVWISGLRNAFDLDHACHQLGLAGAQSRMVCALVRCGDLRLAARDCGVAYSTARDLIGDAMARVGVHKRTSLIDMVTKICIGVAPSELQNWANFMDIWGVSQRQAQIAVAICAEITRDQVARTLGISVATTKKELALVFESTGVRTASELAVVVQETIFVAALSRLIGTGPLFFYDNSEPLRLVVSKSDSRVIGVSDYGPRTGKPVLILHSSSASRPVPRVLVRALQNKGFRPFSIDRPGFGMTDPSGREGDPFVIACDDIRTVCSAFGFMSIDIIARGGAQVGVYFAHQSPEMVKRMVLVAPDPPTRTSKPTNGILGAAKHFIQSNPFLTETLAKVFVSNLRKLDTRSLILKTIAASPPDVAVMQDAQNLADYKRGFQMFTSGKIAGYAAEQAALVREADPPVLRNTGDWHVLVGAHDPLHDPAEMKTYWQSILPNAQYTLIRDGGRFLVMSHPDVIVDGLID